MALKCNIIPVNDPGLFMVNTSTSSYIVHVVTDDLYDKEQVLQKSAGKAHCVSCGMKGR